MGCATLDVQVGYNLHFEFVISVDEIEPQSVPEEEGGSVWQVKLSSWNLSKFKKIIVRQGP